MDDDTIKLLNRINKEFYSTVAKDFDQTRSYYWDGWERLYETLPMIGFQLGKELKVLDVGCGNGRFASFLIDKGETIIYEGLDQSPDLLDSAKDRVKDYKGESKIHFSHFDIVEGSIQDQIDGNKYHLIVLFGVLHHIPSVKLRTEVLGKLLGALDPGGLLVFTSWNFLDDKALSRRLVDWESVGVTEDSLERGDHLLDWKRGERALRYCHAFEREELDQFLQKGDGTLREEYTADGKSGKLNSYYLLGQKEN